MSGKSRTQAVIVCNRASSWQHCGARLQVLIEHQTHLQRYIMVEIDRKMVVYSSAIHSVSLRLPNTVRGGLSTPSEPDGGET